MKIIYRSLEISRRQLEQSGEVLREKENVQGQPDVDEQTTEWDSLKDVPFAGDKPRQITQENSESESEEEEMSM